MATVDWNDAFDNSTYIEGAADYFGKWAKKAMAARSDLSGKTDIAYGAHEREKFDLFLPDSVPRGLIIFVHGGYWHLLDKDHFSHLALGATKQGWAVALIGYPLAPEVRVSQIVSSVAEGVRHAAGLVEGPVRLIGHSAGGHLVSRIICKASPLDISVRQRIEKTVSVSGVHDLRPLMKTKMNEILKLTDAECEAESPVLMKPADNIPMHFWVGANERPEFLRQTELIAECWTNWTNQMLVTFEAGKHHFSVIEGLEYDDSALTSALLNSP